MKKTAILIAILTLALAVASCMKMGGKPLDKRYYRITPIRAGEPTPGQGATVLKIRRLSISDFYNTRELVYQMEGGRMESDFYNMYFVAPANMLTSELRKWLGATGQFSHIIEPGSMVVPTLTLEGVVNSLYGDYSTDQPAAVVAMQFFMVDESTPDNTIVFSKDYQQRIPLDNKEPGALVSAITSGVQTIFIQLENDLATAPLK